MKRNLLLFSVIILFGVVLFFFKSKEITNYSKNNSSEALNQLTPTENAKLGKIITKNSSDLVSHTPTRIISKAASPKVTEPTPENEENKILPTSHRFAVGAQVIVNEVNPTGSGLWKCIGPFGIPEVRWTASGNGAVDHVAIHPTNPAIMYISVRNGGIFKTIDYGKHWVPIVDNFCTGAKCLAISKSDPKILYFGTDIAVWYSSDEGQTWTKRVTLTASAYDIQIDPTNPAIAIMATGMGLLRTTNSGANWTKMASGVFTDINFTDDWSYLATTTNYVNAQTAPTYLASTDRGATWSTIKVTTEYTLIDKVYLALYGTGATMQIFAYIVSEHGTKSGTTNRYLGLYKSTDVGVSFTKITNPDYNYPNGPAALSTNSAGALIELNDTQYASINLYTSATWVCQFFVDPNNANNLTLIREKMFMSNNGGLTWKQNFSYGESNWADNRYMTTNMAKDTVLWCNDGGIWSCALKDFTPTGPVSKVVPKLGDLAIQEGSQCDVSLMNKRVFITGGQDIGQFFTRNGRDTHVASADKYRGRICPFDDTKFITEELLVNNNGYQDTLYDCINAGHFDQQRLYGFTRLKSKTPVKLLRSKSGEDAWIVVGFVGENKANSGGGSWKSTVSNWEPVITATTLGTNTIKPGTFEESWANVNVGLFGDEVGQRVFITNDLTSANPTWTRLVNAPVMTRYRFATHPKNPKLIAVAGVNAVYISRDKGVSWTKKGTFTGDPKVLLFDSTTTEGIYVAVDKTIYYTDVNLTGWIEFNKHLPNDHITDMRMVHYRGGDSRLVISKYGRGVWESPLYSVIANKLKALPDFGVNGASSATIAKNTAVKLNDLSGNTDSISWKIEHESGKFSLSAGNVMEVEFVLPYSGFYHVSQTGHNSNGDSTLTKSNFLFVNYPTCTTYNRTSINLKSADSEVNPATYAFDGNTSTYWLSSNVAQPHQLQIKLNDCVNILNITYTARKDIADGRVADYEVYVSKDGTNWDNYVAKGKLINTTINQTINLIPKSGRYLKFVVLSEVKGLNMAAIGELTLCTVADPFAEPEQSSGLNETHSSTNNLSVYPNPNNGQFHLQFQSNNNDNLKVQILNSLGNIVYDHSYGIENHLLKTNLNVGLLPKGIYFVRVKQNNKTESTKILIQ